MRRNTAILILSHVLNKDVTELLSEIKKNCSKDYDIAFLADNSSRIFENFRDNKDFYLFTTKELLSLNYPGRSGVIYNEETRVNNPHHKDFNFTPGSIELPVLLFYKNNLANNRYYDYYWVIEYDVRYSGSWRSFFSSFSENDADLLGTTLTRYKHIPGWYHWPGLDLMDLPIDKDAYIRGFFPVYRLSARAMAQLDVFYRGGVKGHCECLMPTVLYHAGMTIEDIGGEGEFVRPSNINRHYRNTPVRGTLAPGTFVFRPVMARAGREPNMLWHPVKYMPVWQRTLQALETRSAQVARRITRLLARNP